MSKHTKATRVLALKRLTRSAYRAALVALSYVVVASMVLDSFMLSCGLRDGDVRYGFDALMSRTAYRPFVFRVLAPSIVDLVARATRPGLAPRILASGERTGLQPDPTRPTRVMSERFHWVTGDLWQHYVAYFLLFAALLVVLATWRGILREVGGFSRAFQDFAPAIGLSLLTITFTCGGYVYDFPELALAGLCFLALLRKQWSLYYPMLVLSCLNKETGILIGVMFAGMYAAQMPRARLAAHLALHAVLTLPILVGTRMLFRANPGDDTENHLTHNIGYLLSARPYAAFHDVDARLIPIPGPLNAVVLFVVFLAVAYRWREHQPLVRRALVSILVPLVPLFLAFGFQDEVRAFYLALAPMFVLACDTLRRIHALADQADSVESARAGWRREDRSREGRSREGRSNGSKVAPVGDLDGDDGSFAGHGSSGAIAPASAP